MHQLAAENHSLVRPYKEGYLYQSHLPYFLISKAKTNQLNL